ncbi:MAG: ECF transporter S component [Eubacteriales bacterium]
MKQQTRVLQICMSGLFLALALVLPYLTGQLQQVGQMFLPMHIPVLLCGFICGGSWGAAVGFTAPLLRFLIAGMPPIMPVGLAMAFELAVYGLVAGYLFRQVTKKNLLNTYLVLLAAMLAGRVLWGVVSAIIFGFRGGSFGMNAFVAGAFVTALPGIILQLLVIPPWVQILRKQKVYIP